MALQKSDVILLLSELQEKGFDVNTDIITVEEARIELMRVFGRKQS